ncbi:MAG: exodeoxyribonuclease VII small subunit [Clostridiales bacterium]
MTGKDSFEDKMKNFEKIIKKLENGELSLDQSIEVFHEGMKLSKDLSKRLDEAENKINELIVDKDGNIKERKNNTGE